MVQQVWGSMGRARSSKLCCKSNSCPSDPDPKIILGAHNLSSKSILPYIEPKKTKICEWEEVDTSFVGESLPKETKL